MFFFRRDNKLPVTGNTSQVGADNDVGGGEKKEDIIQKRKMT